MTGGMAIISAFCYGRPEFCDGKFPVNGKMVFGRKTGTGKFSWDIKSIRTDAEHKEG
mgnify:CR=1 FL=1